MRLSLFLLPPSRRCFNEADHEGFQARLHRAGDRLKSAYRQSVDSEAAQAAANSTSTSTSTSASSQSWAAAPLGPHLDAMDIFAIAWGSDAYYLLALGGFVLSFVQHPFPRLGLYGAHS